MPAKSQPEAIPTSGHALQLYRTLVWTPENRRVIALAYIDETGDIPVGVEHSFGMEAADKAESDAIDQEMDELRKQHFAEIGKPVPARTNTPLR